MKNNWQKLYKNLMIIVVKNIVSCEQVSIAQKVCAQV